MKTQNSSLKISAVIPAGGLGKRLYRKIRKPYINLLGKPILFYTISIFEKADFIREIICAVCKDDLSYCRKNIVEKFGFKKVKLVAGGKKRSDSVRNGLSAVSGDSDIIVIHDSVRPFLDEDILKRSINAALRFGASCVAVKTKNTIKKVDKNFNIIETPDRNFLWDAQTPQTFKASLIQEAYRKTKNKKKIFTDDASLVEALGKKVKIVEGSWKNIKITTPEDLKVAESILKGE